jgi:hypothetical protein
MDIILSDIKSVPGVTGTLVLAKQSLSCYHLLPASFNATSIRQVVTRLLDLSERMPPHSRLNLKFESGVGLVYNLERSLVLIFGKSDLDFSVLGFVLKSALQSIERQLQQQEAGPEVITRESASVIDKDNLSLLIEAINLVAQGHVRNQGTFWVTKNLRRTKEDVIKEFPQISSFYVDNHGKVSVLRTPKEVLDQKTPLAMAKWIDLFINKVPHPARRDRVADIKELTALISKPLEGIGFYDLYSKVRKK